MQEQLDRMEESQRRLEAKVDALLDALADDADIEVFDLDGHSVGRERDQGESL